MKIKQTDIATQLNISQPVVSKWKRGKSRPKGLFLDAVKEKLPALLKELANKYPDLYTEEERG